MPSRRHILPAEQLRLYDAQPIYPSSIKNTSAASATAATRVFAGSNEADTTTRQQHQQQEEEEEAVGIRIGGWDITTSRCTIANEMQMEELTKCLEDAASGEMKGEGNDNGDAADSARMQGKDGKTNRRRRRPRRRRLCPPEIVFLDANVSIQRGNNNNYNYSYNNSASEEGADITVNEAIDDTDDDNKGSIDEKEIVEKTSTAMDTSLEIRFEARDALVEWASAHGHLPFPYHGVDVDDNEAANVLDDEASSHSSTTSSSSVPLVSYYRGVSILQSVDAKLWSSSRQNRHPMTLGIGRAARKNEKTQQRQLGGGQQASNVVTSSKATVETTTSTAIATPATMTEFHFDWTYSTPYAGTVRTPSSASSSSSSFSHPYPSSLSSDDNHWTPITTSGMNMSLLTDRTQPILFYDDITLYEDDMHDNGDVSLTCKIRVMPKCFYVLLRLYVRVDRVILRVRDTRIFHEFDRSGATTTTPTTGSAVYRDVTWRECKWEELGKFNLPSDPGSWRDGGVGGGDGAQRLNGLLNRLPMVDRSLLPVELASGHAVMEIDRVIMEGL